MKTIGSAVDNSFIKSFEEQNKTMLKSGAKQQYFGTKALNITRKTVRPETSKPNKNTFGYQSSNTDTMKQLFNKFTSSKVNSRLAAYDGRGFIAQTKYDYSNVSRYALSEKASQINTEFNAKNTTKGPFKSNRMILRQIPTSSVVKQMEITKKLHESKTEYSDLAVSKIKIYMFTF